MEGPNASRCSHHKLLPPCGSAYSTEIDRSLKETIFRCALGSPEKPFGNTMPASALAFGPGIPIHSPNTLAARSTSGTKTPACEIAAIQKWVGSAVAAVTRPSRRGV
jgi:hypothetical protein